ncbi:hypothetical protein QBC39DRAFT_163153 [Podospora conica]|nr:hypothetical protein QBC39DRAFT_163153 [Schizothecium conicum]
MPVIHPSSQKPECWGRRARKSSRYPLSTSPDQLLSAITTHANHSPPHPRPQLVQSSFTTLTPSSTTHAAKNGFVYACIEAYNEHHNLVLRPDDIWLAILTQLSSHINANAATLRSRLVSHDGQKSLHLELELTPTLDHGAVAQSMTALLASTLPDPSLRDWFLPSFTTTTKTDSAVAAIAFLGAMQKFYAYSWGTRCGIPAVRLLGVEADWRDIASRCASRLGGGEFGPEPAAWYRDALRPVLAGLVESFRDPGGDAARAFWAGVVDEEVPNGSGSPTYSGWITAFCYWDEKGVCLHRPRPGDGAVRLTMGEMPMGFVKVPVTLWDNGVQVPTEMVAGSVGMRVRRWEEGQGGEGSGRDGLDTLQPEAGWFMYYV